MKPRSFLIVYLSLFAASVRSATPLILNHSETSGNGEIIYIQGSDFGSNPIIEYSYNDSHWTTVPTITSGNGTATFRIPGSETWLPDAAIDHSQDDERHILSSLNAQLGKSSCKREKCRV